MPHIQSVLRLRYAGINVRHTTSRCTYAENLIITITLTLYNLNILEVLRIPCPYMRPQLPKFITGANVLALTVQLYENEYCLKFFAIKCISK